MGGHAIALTIPLTALAAWLYKKRSARIARKGAMASPPDNLLHATEMAGQDHVFADWHKLTLNQQIQLLQQLSRLDFALVNHIFRTSQVQELQALAPPQPIQQVTPYTEDMGWVNTGFQLIAHGKLGVLLLAGGQGTRLGSKLPKGCFDIGLPSHKSLFQLQAERLLKLQNLAATAVWGPGSNVQHEIRLYIMTSPATDVDTKQFFEEHAYFGLRSGQIVFFQQGEQPCLTEDGKLIMESSFKVAMAPDGNGGVYRALLENSILDDMHRNGVQCVDCVSVDNALVRPADPLFVGHCWDSAAPCGARVVAKSDPSEKVGVFAKRNGSIQVIEYSELTENQAHMIDPRTRMLAYNWANMCMQYFTVDFLQVAAHELHRSNRYHIAHKQIPSKGRTVPGIKMELFIFDTFSMAPKVALFEVPREQQFAPVKNASRSGVDSPDTARDAILSLHQRWVEGAGGRVATPKKRHLAGVEISPLVSLNGEGLEEISQARIITGPYDKFLQGDVPPQLVRKQLSEARQQSVSLTASSRRMF